MRTALLDRPLIIHAQAIPPRDRTSLTLRAAAKCKDAYEFGYNTAIEKGLGSQKALRMAAVAYKLAMPRLESIAAIRAAIACIAQGIALEVFDGRDGSQLLYAAQVAISTLKAKGGKKK